METTRTREYESRSYKSSQIRSTPRSQLTCRAKAPSIEAFFNAEVNTSRAISLICRNFSRSEGIAVMSGIIRVAALRLSYLESANPVFDCLSHLFQTSFEEVVTSFNSHKFFWIRKCAYQRFQFPEWAELVTRATY